MVNLRSTVVGLSLALTLALVGCQTTARQELRKFVNDLQMSADSVRADGKAGIYTLEVYGGESGIVFLPAHSSAASLGLSQRVTSEIDQVASNSATARVFLIRDNRLVSEQPLDPTMVVTPAYSHKREMQFKIARSKQTPQNIEITLLEQ